MQHSQSANRIGQLVTGVLTSCGRHDLLELTLQSFFAVNSAPLDRLIVVEDGPEIAEDVRGKFSGHRIDWIATGKRVGQIAAIDYAYSRVRTPYIFHMEDDWQFLRPEFIERSAAILDRNPKCLQVWIRAVDDTQFHPVEDHVYVTRGVQWRRMALDYMFKGEWHGFSFNPGLRRLNDYVSIGGYGLHTRFDPANPGLAECTISKLFRQRDFYAAILCDDGGSGYVRHAGAGRHVGPREAGTP